MPAIKRHFRGLSGSQYLCERYDPAVHSLLPDDAGVIVITGGMHLAPGLLAAHAVDNISQSLGDEAARAALKEEHPQADDFWFSVRAADSPRARQQVADDLMKSRV